MFRNWLTALGAAGAAAVTLLLTPSIGTAQGTLTGPWRGQSYGGRVYGWAPLYSPGDWNFPWTGYVSYYADTSNIAPGYYVRDTGDYRPAFSISRSGNRAASVTSGLVAEVDVDLSRADARLTANGKQTRQRGKHREFETNPIRPGQTYTIHFVATWSDNGRVVRRTRSVTVRPGDHTTVAFTGQDSDQAAKPATAGERGRR